MGSRKDAMPRPASFDEEPPQMEFLPLVHAPDDARQPLMVRQIREVTARAFGPAAQIESAHELGGGEYNTVYRIVLAGHEPVILRAAPSPARSAPWHEELLMRREHTIHPYFAALGSRLPKTLFVDFTHDVMDRDYLFQTCLPGKQWSALSSTLTPEEEAPLWRELARLAKTINNVAGDVFGHPHPGRQFATWSLTMLDWLERVVHDIERAGLSAAEVRAILDRAHAATVVLDEITRPHLLHGDLWTFNVLIARDESGWRITAMLDCDRASWGDPLADWTFHLLPRRASPEALAIFWDEYGHPRETATSRFRDLVYEGMHAGNVLADCGRRGDVRVAEKARAVLERVAGELRATRLG